MAYLSRIQPQGTFVDVMSLSIIHFQLILLPRLCVFSPSPNPIVASHLFVVPVPVRTSREEMEANDSPANQYDFSIVVQVSSLVFPLGFWIVSIFLTRILETRSERFRDMDIRRRRNVVIYIMEIVATTYVFVALTAFLPRLITVTRVEDPLNETNM